LLIFVLEKCYVGLNVSLSKRLETVRLLKCVIKFGHLYLILFLPICISIYEAWNIFLIKSFTMQEKCPDSCHMITVRIFLKSLPFREIQYFYIIILSRNRVMVHVIQISQEIVLCSVYNLDIPRSKLKNIYCSK
jgi:hypothetical protein